MFSHVLRNTRDREIPKKTMEENSDETITAIIKDR